MRRRRQQQQQQQQPRQKKEKEDEAGSDARACTSEAAKSRRTFMWRILPYRILLRPAYYGRADAAPAAGCCCCCCCTSIGFWSRERDYGDNGARVAGIARSPLLTNCWVHSSSPTIEGKTSRAGYSHRRSPYARVTRPFSRGYRYGISCVLFSCSLASLVNERVVGYQRRIQKRDTLPFSRMRARARTSYRVQ